MTLPLECFTLYFFIKRTTYLRWPPSVKPSSKVLSTHILYSLYSQLSPALLPTSPIFILIMIRNILKILLGFPKD